MAAHEKAIIVNKFWATVITSIVSAAIIGAFGYAWSANADLEVLKKNVAEIKAADTQIQLIILKTDVAIIKEQLRGGAETTKRIEVQQTRMDDKLDKLLQRPNR